MISIYKPPDRNPGIIILLILLCLMFSANINSYAQKKKTKSKIPDFGVNVGFTTTYDDNILKYSDKYLTRFLNQQDEGRFHIETYDDVILQPSVGLSASYRVFGKMRSEFNADFSRRFYVVNDIKNWNFFALGYRQYLTKKASFKLTYSYIPEFYIRHFRDEDWVKVYGFTPETFVPMSFSKDFYGFWIQNTFGRNTVVRGSASYSQYFYDKNYTEYDSKDQSFGIKVNQPLNKNIRLELGYELTLSDAKGYDMPGETKETSTNSDASFVDDTYTARISAKLPKVFKMDNSISIEGEFAKRYFTSKHYLEVDPTHAGRVDDVYVFSVNYDLAINKSFGCSAFYNFFMRDSNTTAPENQEYVSAEKDYKQNQVGISVNYNIKF